jgi:hypothetical protein
MLPTLFVGDKADPSTTAIHTLPTLCTSDNAPFCNGGQMLDHSKPQVNYLGQPNMALRSPTTRLCWNTSQFCRLEDIGGPLPTWQSANASPPALYFRQSHCVVTDTITVDACLFGRREWSAVDVIDRKPCCLTSRASFRRISLLQAACALKWDSCVRARPLRPVTPGDKQDTSTPQLRNGGIVVSPP